MDNMLWEPLRFVCQEWIDYDNMFRQQDWLVVIDDHVLYSLTFLSQQVESITCTKSI